MQDLITNNILLFEALHLASLRHKAQQRKGADRAPYINHLIHVTFLLIETGKENDLQLLLSAILHDILEDTVSSEEDREQLSHFIKNKFGKEVLSIVLEVTDDKSLPKQERKRLQIQYAPGLSLKARKLKIADKISNLMDIINHPPKDWDNERKKEYFAWAKAVVDKIRGCNKPLEKLFDKVHDDFFKSN